MRTGQVTIGLDIGRMITGIKFWNLIWIKYLKQGLTVFLSTLWTPIIIGEIEMEKCVEELIK